MGRQDFKVRPDNKVRREQVLMGRQAFKVRLDHKVPQVFKARRE
jgi:hypothetical protein